MKTDDQGGTPSVVMSVRYSLSDFDGDREKMKRFTEANKAKSNKSEMIRKAGIVAFDIEESGKKNLHDELDHYIKVHGIEGVLEKLGSINERLTHIEDHHQNHQNRMYDAMTTLIEKLSNLPLAVDGTIGVDQPKEEEEKTGGEAYSSDFFDQF